MEPINRGIEEKLFRYLLNSIEITPYYQLIGLKTRVLGPGFTELIVDVAQKHTNPLGAVHGGLYMSLADAAMANAVRTLGVKGLTVECATSIMAGAVTGETICARGMVEKAGNNIIFASARIMAGEKLLTSTRGTFYKIGLIDMDHGS